LAKNNRIKLDFDGATYVLGLASNERIWKLCWELNQALKLTLGNEVPDFSRPAGGSDYNDLESDPDFEYFLIENTNKTAKIAKIAQSFRYWLVIKPHQQKVPDLETMIRKLKSAEAISMVMDLTPFNQDKPFLP
jgi:hypothetical protein